MNHSVRVIASMVFVVGTLILFTSSSRLVDGVLTQWKTSFEDNDRTNAAFRRHYSTVDAMRYILYGVGDQYSPYDQQLVEYIRGHISQPSLNRPRHLTTTEKTDASQEGQSAFVDKFLSGRRGGFFIECGAADGEKFSNSLFFELERNWTGILIEANQAFHRALLDKNRRAYVLHACLSIERRPTTVVMQPAGLVGGIVSKMHQSHVVFMGASKKKQPAVAMNCFPLNAIMAALDVSHVDYLSLDVEGPEIEILRTVDWTRLRIDVITVEYRIYGGSKIGIDKSATLKKLKDLRTFFHDTGLYREVAVLPPGNEVDGLDIVLARI